MGLMKPEPFQHINMKSFKESVRHLRMTVLVPLSLAFALALQAAGNTDPTLIGRWSGQAVSVAVQGQYAYVAGTTNGLQVLDQQPLRPGACRRLDD